MKSVNDIVQFSPMECAIDLPCEIVPQHIIPRGGNYAMLSVQKDVLIPDGEGLRRPVRVEVKLRVCYDCLGTYIAQLTAVHRDIFIGKK
jgi:hypothetical protein